MRSYTSPQKGLTTLQNRATLKPTKSTQAENTRINSLRRKKKVLSGKQHHKFPKMRKTSGIGSAGNSHNLPIETRAPVGLLEPPER